MTTIVLLATAWGTKAGGINSFNLDFARALGAELGSRGQVVCVVPSVTDDQAAREPGVKLVSLGMPPTAELPASFDPLWTGTVAMALSKQGIGRVDWWIGHDVVSGAAANRLRDEMTQGRTAAFMHMSYRDYQGLKHGSAQEAQRKYEQQRNIFEKADQVLAVGPLLRDRAKDIVRREVAMVVPGLPGITPRPPESQIVALSFGRFEPKNDRIKQVRLAVAGFAAACRPRTGGPRLLSDGPMLKLLGVSGKDEASKLQTLAQEVAGGMLNVLPLAYEEDRAALHRHIAESNLAMMLSWHEGFGLTGWEALDAELPLIVSVRSGLYKLLEENSLETLAHGVTIAGHLGAANEDDEEPNFTPEDQERVASKIVEIAGDLLRAIRRAKQLKDALVRCDFTWASAARTVLNALDVPPDGGPSGPGPGKADPPTTPAAPAGPAPPTTGAASGPAAVAPGAPASPADDLLDSKELTWDAPFDPPESVLLRAEYRVVPFHAARAPLVEELLAWAGHPAKTISLRLHTGDGGSGKTRLAIELCRRLREVGWAAGFLPEGAEAARIRMALERSTNSLVVVDYAETRRRDLTSLVQAALRMPKGHRLRVLMLARAAGDWWDRLADDAGDKSVAAVLASPDYTMGPYPLPPLVLADEQRERVFREALAAFAERIGKSPENVVSPSLSSPHFSDALFVHLAALGALRGEQLESAPALLDMSVGRERAYWKHAVSNEGLPDAWLDGVEQAVALLILANGAPTTKDARALVAGAPRLRGLSPQQHDHVVDLLRRIYPQRGGIDALRPDLVGERVVHRALGHDDGVLDAAFVQGAPDRRTRGGLTVLTRLARHGKAEAKWLYQALEGDRLARLAGLAVKVSIEAGDPLPHAVSEALRDASPRVQHKVVPDLRILIPDETVALQELAVCVAEIWLSFQREKNVDKNRGKRADMAEAHRVLGVRLRRAGHPERAREEQESSLRLFRDLDEPAAVAASCRSLAVTLAALGLHDEALSATRESEAIYRRLTQRKTEHRGGRPFALANPDAYRADWAMSLCNLAIHLCDVGQYDEALRCARRAEEGYHQLSRSHPDTYLPNWAMSLNNLANQEHNAGHHNDALTHAHMAEKIYRQLAERHPDAYQPVWATSLSNLASHLRNVGQYNDASMYARKAEGIRRRLAESRPDAYRAHWARSLGDLASHGGDVGQYEEAFAYARRAEGIIRHLDKSRPGAYQADLAQSLSNLAYIAKELGQHENALAYAREAESILRELAAARSDVHRGTLARLLAQLAEALVTLNRVAEAAPHARESAAISAELATRYPAKHRPDEGYSRALLAEVLLAEGNRDGSKTEAEASVACLTEVPFRPPLAEPLARALDVLARALGALGQHEAALSAVSRAAEVLQRENERRPLALREIKRRVAETRAELARMVPTAPPAATPPPVADTPGDG